jgi:RNA polymerase sigma-70 factor (ECF subfamily)
MALDPQDEMLEHLPSLRAFAMSLTRDRPQADDLVQETIMRAWDEHACLDVHYSA